MCQVVIGHSFGIFLNTKLNLHKYLGKIICQLLLYAIYEGEQVCYRI